MKAIFVLLKEKVKKNTFMCSNVEQRCGIFMLFYSTVNPDLSWILFEKLFPLRF